MNLPRTGRVLGFVGWIMLKVGMARRIVWVAAGTAAVGILVLLLFVVVLPGR